MQVLNSSIDPAVFFRRIDESAERVLMLDYDGTLAPFEIERSQAGPYPDLIPTLEKLAASNRTRVAIISGRTIKDLRNLLCLASLPELWGCHGLERLSRDSRYETIEVNTSAAHGLREFEQWIHQARMEDYVETKPSGYAFHWRGKPRQEALRVESAVKSAWSDDPHHFHLMLRDFDGGLEIRVPVASKANAVSRLMSESSEAVTAAYCGDDLTDEDAFAALGDRGLKVLVRDALRPTKADIWIKPPRELADFLDRWI